MNHTAALIDALEPLALGPFEQMAYLAALGAPAGVDELALQFDDVFRSVHPTGDTALDATLSALDGRFSAMSGLENAALWTPHALEHEADWSFIRETALRAVTFARAMDVAHV